MVPTTLDQQTQEPIDLVEVHLDFLDNNQSKLTQSFNDAKLL